MFTQLHTGRGEGRVWLSHPSVRKATSKRAQGPACCPLKKRSPAFPKLPSPTTMEGASKNLPLSAHGCFKNSGISGRKPRKNSLPASDSWHPSFIQCQPALPSLPIQVKDRKFGSKRPLPTLRKPRAWPWAGASGKGPVSRALLHSHHTSCEDGATTKCGHALPSPW